MPQSSQPFLDHAEALEPDREFCFACHSGLPCYGACCRRMTLDLTPYDALRLRRSLGLGSEAFIKRYAAVRVHPGHGFPTLRLTMDGAGPSGQSGEDGSCPFLTREGCAHYQDRPGACRLYPVGRATAPATPGEQAAREELFLLREPHCQGFATGPTWQAQGWMEDQGLVAYLASNDRLMGLMAAVRGVRPPLDPRMSSMVLLALYQPDGFREFILKMGLFDRLELTEERKARVVEDEEETLSFAFDWLELLLLGRSPNLTRRS